MPLRGTVTFNTDLRYDHRFSLSGLAKRYVWILDGQAAGFGDSFPMCAA